MNQLRKLMNWLTSPTSDMSFIHQLEIIESIISKILSLAMLSVIIGAIIHLCAYLVGYLFDGSHYFSDSIGKVFGLFLDILIALEILENITAYLKKHVIQVELVIATSLTAVARKIILFDFKETKGEFDLLGLAAATIALSIGYWLVRQSNHENQS
jgi:uncharacterized membrane protein (DUF373 family)